MIVVCFVNKFIDLKIDKVKFDILPKTNEQYISVTYCCYRFIDSYRFLSNRSDSLVKTVVDDSNKTLKILKNENIHNDEILDFVNEIIKEDQIIKDLKMHYTDKIKNFEEALLNYMVEDDLNLL